MLTSIPFTAASSTDPTAGTTTTSTAAAPATLHSLDLTSADVVSSVLQANKSLAARQRKLLIEPLSCILGELEQPAVIYHQFQDAPFFQDNLKQHEQIRHLIVADVMQRKAREQEKICRLKKEYSQQFGVWRKKADEMELALRKRASIDIGSSLAGNGITMTSNAAPPSSTQISLQEQSKPPLFPSTTRVSRRNAGAAGASMFASDSVKSEAEWQEVLAMIAAAEGIPNSANEAKILAQSAVEPPMVLDPTERQALLFDNTNGLIVDPEAHLKDENEKLHMKWTQDERDLFKAKLLQFGKNFPKIASHLSNKTTQDCIEYFYRQKYEDNLKQLMRKGKGAKRKAPKRAPPKTAGLTKSRASILGNMEVADDRDVEEDIVNDGVPAGRKLDDVEPERVPKNGASGNETFEALRDTDQDAADENSDGLVLPRKKGGRKQPPNKRKAGKREIELPGLDNGVVAEYGDGRLSPRRRRDSWTAENNNFVHERLDGRVPSQEPELMDVYTEDSGGVAEVRARGSMYDMEARRNASPTGRSGSHDDRTMNIHYDDVSTYERLKMEENWRAPRHSYHEQIPGNLAGGYDVHGHEVYKSSVDGMFPSYHRFHPMGPTPDETIPIQYASPRDYPGASYAVSPYTDIGRGSSNFRSHSLSEMIAPAESIQHQQRFAMAHPYAGVNYSPVPGANFSHIDVQGRQWQSYAWPPQHHPTQPALSQAIAHQHQTIPYSQPSVQHLPQQHPSAYQFTPQQVQYYGQQPQQQHSHPQFAQYQQHQLTQQPQQQQTHQPLPLPPQQHHQQTFQQHIHYQQQQVRQGVVHSQPSHIAGYETATDSCSQTIPYTVPPQHIEQYQGFHVKQQQAVSYAAPSQAQHGQTPHQIQLVVATHQPAPPSLPSVTRDLPKLTRPSLANLLS